MPETSTQTGIEPASAPEESAVPSGAEMIEQYENYCYRDDLDYLDDLRMLLMEQARRARPAGNPAMTIGCIHPNLFASTKNASPTHARPKR